MSTFILMDQYAHGKERKTSCFSANLQRGALLFWRVYYRFSLSLLCLLSLYIRVSVFVYVLACVWLRGSLNGSSL